MKKWYGRGRIFKDRLKSWAVGLSPRVSLHPIPPAVADLGVDAFECFVSPGTGAPSSNILSDISSALYLWTQESQILDGGSVHHCVATVKKDVLPVLEKDLEEQIGGLRETERKKRKDEEAKLAAEASKKEKGKAKGKMYELISS